MWGLINQSEGTAADGFVIAGDGAHSAATGLGGRNILVDIVDVLADPGRFEIECRDGEFTFVLRCSPAC